MTLEVPARSCQLNIPLDHFQEDLQGSARAAAVSCALVSGMTDASVVLDLV